MATINFDTKDCIIKWKRASAEGEISFSANPSLGDILIIDLIPFTIVTTAVTSTEVTRGGSLAATLTNIKSKLDSYPVLSGKIQFTIVTSTKITFTKITDSVGYYPVDVSGCSVATLVSYSIAFGYVNNGRNDSTVFKEYEIRLFTGTIATYDPFAVFKTLYTTEPELVYYFEDMNRDLEFAAPELVVEIYERDINNNTSLPLILEAVNTNGFVLNPQTLVTRDQLERDSVSFPVSISTALGVSTLDAVNEDFTQIAIIDYVIPSTPGWVGSAPGRTPDNDPAIPSQIFISSWKPNGVSSTNIKNNSFVDNEGFYKISLSGLVYEYPPGAPLDPNGAPSSITVTGGVTTTSGAYTVATFTSSTNTGGAGLGGYTPARNKYIEVSGGTLRNIEYVIAAGGGGGGCRETSNFGGGGGGGGGLKTNKTATYYNSISFDPYKALVTPGTKRLYVEVGNGGAGGTTSGTGGSNGNSSELYFEENTAGYEYPAVFKIQAEGGGGGSSAGVGKDGGCGGGGRIQSSVYGYGNIPASRTGEPSQGFRGGKGIGSSGTSQRAGGGGGATAKGVNATTGSAGDGGAGYTTPLITSGSAVLCSGGGGSCGDGASPPNRGLGGTNAGDGGTPGTPAGSNGVANKGGGGGGGRNLVGGNGGNGGSGVVIVRWPTNQAALIPLQRTLLYETNTTGNNIKNFAKLAYVEAPNLGQPDLFVETEVAEQDGKFSNPFTLTRSFDGGITNNWTAGSTISFEMYYSFEVDGLDPGVSDPLIMIVDNEYSVNLINFFK